MKQKSNFDLYLEEQLRDPDFAERFEKAGEAWDVAIQLSSLRKATGLSQKELAEKVKEDSDGHKKRRPAPGRHEQG